MDTQTNYCVKTCGSLLYDARVEPPECLPRQYECEKAVRVGNQRKCVSECPAELSWLGTDKICTKTCVVYQVDQRTCLPAATPAACAFVVREEAGQTWCADACDASLLIYKNSETRMRYCLESCPADARFVGAGQTCAESCPRYVQSSRCVESCAEGLVLQERTCRTRCAGNRVLLESVCVLAGCPSFFHVLPAGTKQCHPNGCPSQFFVSRGLECVSACPEGSWISVDGECVDPPESRGNAWLVGVIVVLALVLALLVVALILLVRAKRRAASQRGRRGRHRSLGHDIAALRREQE